MRVHELVIPSGGVFARHLRSRPVVSTRYTLDVAKTWLRSNQRSVPSHLRHHRAPADLDDSTWSLPLA